MSRGEDDEYFADGLTEEILNSLTRVPELLVTARTSAFHFKGQDIPVPEIADALGVAHIIESSVRRGGDELRVTAQLIRADDGFHLWSKNYDWETVDTFGVAHGSPDQIGLLLAANEWFEKALELEPNIADAYPAHAELPWPPASPVNWPLKDW